MFQFIQVDTALLTASASELRRRWGWFLALGIAMAVVGLLALGASVFVTLASMFFLGWLLAIGGALHIVHSFGTGSWSGLFMHLLVGILYVVVGLLTIVHPVAGALSLTLLLAALFMVGGLFRIVTAAAIRLPHWGWMLLNGIITFILGLVIWAQWPISGLWAIGLFIGIDLLLSGWSFIMLALKARTMAGSPEPRAAI